MHNENRITERCWKILLTIKNLLLIDNDLSVNFWTEKIDTVNNLQNFLLTMRANKLVIVLKEAWTTVRQNVEHLCIIGSKASSHIPVEKQLKLDIHKI